MTTRLSRIVTRTGDDGNTGLSDGSRVPKHCARMEAIGTVDELNCQLGVLLAEIAADPRGSDAIGRLFPAVQNDLFDLGGELSMPGVNVLDAAAWEALEKQIEALNGELDALANFILPGGSRVIAQMHVARAVARRAERCVSALHAECSAAGEGDLVNEHSRIYLNRLSDLCFVAARWLGRERGELEVLWQQKKAR